MFLHVVSTSYIDHYKIKIQFNDNRTAIVDLADTLKGKIFDPLRDLILFQQFKVDAELGTICWPNGADLAPEYFYFLAFQDLPELQEQFEQCKYLQTKVVTN